MTAAEWDRSDDPGRMLEAAGRRLSDRKLLLFACGCARRAWNLMPESARPAVLITQLAADTPDPDERDELLREALTTVGGSLAELVLRLQPVFLMPRLPPGYIARQAATILRLLEQRAGLPDREHAATGGLALVLDLTDRSHPGQAAVLRCVAGNPFRRTPLDPAWLTSDVLALAAGVYADEAFDRLPILADALQDAGCESDRVLSHLRSAGPHHRGCWVVDMILDKS
jgi:hypothetical protein